MAVSESTINRPVTGRGFRPAVVLAFVCLGQFMVFIDASIVNLALPSIRHGLDMSQISLNYVVTAYGTVLGGFLLLGGRLADAFGRRRVLQAGLVVFALASLASGLARNGSLLVTARAVQGLGSAFITPAALSILTSAYPEGPQRNKALGVWGSLVGIASIAGVIAGGLLAGGPGWRWIFWINVPIGLGAAALAPRLVPESRPAGNRRSFDTVGAATLTVGLLLLIFTLGQATTVGWATLRTIGSLAGVAVLLGLFVLTESRAASPMMPPRIARLKTMRTANIGAVLVFGTFAAMFFFASIFMQQVVGYSPMKAGFAYTPLAVCVAAGAGVASTLITKIAARPVLIGGLVLTIAGLTLLWRTPAGGSYPTSLLLPFLVLGLGAGLCYVTLQVAAFAGIGDQEAGIGAGLINTSQEVGSALGLAIIATVAYNGLAAKLAAAGGRPALIRAAQASADHDAFLAAACSGFAALLLALFFMPHARDRSGHQGQRTERSFVMSRIGVRGTVAEGFEEVRDEFAAVVTEEAGESGPQLSVYANGRQVVDLWAGEQVTGESLTGVYSSAKAAAYLVIALLVQDGVLDLDRTVAYYWPEFASEGKAGIALRDLLTHRAGLPGVDGGFSAPELADDRLIAQRLVGQRPYWKPGAAYGYHCYVMGALAGEVARRATGQSIQELYEERIRMPYGLDLYLGLPEALEPRYLPVLPRHLTPEQQVAFEANSPSPYSLAGIAYNLNASPPTDPVQVPNSRVVRAHGQASAGGVGNARGLAALYAASISEVNGRAPLLKPGILAEFCMLHSTGTDLVRGDQGQYSLGFEAKGMQYPFLSANAFGHTGTAGSEAFADPPSGIAYAYTRRRCAPGWGAPENHRLAAAVMRAAAAAAHGSVTPTSA